MKPSPRSAHVGRCAREIVNQGHRALASAFWPSGGRRHLHRRHGQVESKNALAACGFKFNRCLFPCTSLFLVLENCPPVKHRHTVTLCDLEHVRTMDMNPSRVSQRKATRGQPELLHLGRTNNEAARRVSCNPQVVEPVISFRLGGVVV